MLPAIRLGPHFHPHLSSDSCVKVLLRVKYVMWGGEKSFFQKDLWIAPRWGSLRIFSKTIVCPFQQVVYSRDLSAVLGGRDSFSNLRETTWLLPQRYLLLRRHSCKPSCLLTPHPPTFRVRCRFHCQLDGNEKLLASRQPFGWACFREQPRSWNQQLRGSCFCR